ncbi:hypothetical protein L226DRAFT_539458 [Lentinus tigrinus ALCF2SS1-7]|uniref:uncharacterized protein n=1 Tax=Lentinus tigrinus ALCF2SS1-7 TaxID=1328758 RepID=UPI0011660F59|nr:hypothetical protein L226DRAFT_539458 [Lentinus tigrinus ALCF2SS1-7]
MKQGMRPKVVSTQSQTPPHTRPTEAAHTRCAPRPDVHGPSHTPLVPPLPSMSHFLSTSAIPRHDPT